MPYSPFKHEANFAYGRSEEILNQALASAFTALPPVRHRDLFPPRIGYDRSVLLIEDVITTSRQAGPDYRYDYSGTRGAYMGTSRPGIGLV